MSKRRAPVNYSVRPAKNIERKMLCDALSRLRRIEPHTEYRYVGLGAIGFHDHALIHRRLGITDMVSIEQREDWKRRLRLNRPYRCIRMEWGWSHDILPSFTWRKRTIIWLDYEGQLDVPKLEDIETVVANARSGSVLIVTVNAHPRRYEPDQDMPQRRLEALRKAVGEERVPFDVEGKHLVQWGVASVFRRCITAEIKRVLLDRNAALPFEEQVHYTQLFNFQYADGLRMLTVGGLIADESDQDRFFGSDIEQLHFIRREADPYSIEVPYLTIREVRYLDQRLPRTASEVREFKMLPVEEIEKYRRIYRYFPSFTEIEAS